MNDEKKVPESFKTYEEGKHRRYTLLFAVNGGAFALAKLIVEKDPSTASLGGLRLSYMCYGMALFTIVMSMDIFMFGQKMRRIYLPDSFGWQGKIVLMLIGALICAAWILVAR
jgi:hypothetical protein